MINKLHELFSSENGINALTAIRRAIDGFKMQDLLRGGAVVGLSGGADSMLLLLSLYRLREEYGIGRLVAVHINHMIRGAEADADEAFCKRVADVLKIPFRSYRIDIPALARERGRGIEETARDERYRVFSEVSEELRLSSVAIAHNSTDNLETVIINMMRGAGIDGLAGISPVRDNILRPLIYLSKSEITALLDGAGIPFVIDSTNASVEYTRNYVRGEIIPRLRHLNPEPEKMATRLSQNLREDALALSRIASDFIGREYKCGVISTSALAALDKSIFFRVIRDIARQKYSSSIERTHLEAIYDGLSSPEFSYSLPGKIRFSHKGGYAFFCEDERDSITPTIPETALTLGVNNIDGFSSVIILSTDPSFESYSNVYKISISAAIPSDIINDVLTLRGKRDADAYTYGGSTRRLKKLFNDRGIPTDKRPLVPVIADKEGIVWVAGFGVRGEGEVERGAYIAVAEPIHPTVGLQSLYITNRR